MKQLLISIHRRHNANIESGLKTREIRKQIPKGFVGWVNSYETKADGGRGMITNRWWFDEYEEISVDSICFLKPLTYTHKQIDMIINDSCLYLDELLAYAGETHNKLYAMHIKKLEIFENPKALSDFLITKNVKTTNHKFIVTKVLHKAPQNFMYVEVEE